MKLGRGLPGFRLSAGLGLFGFSILILLPLSLVGLTAGSRGLSYGLSSALSERALYAYGLSFGASFVAALANAIFGLIVAWVLTRYDFPGRRVVDALVDLPFALPTAVAGIALTALYAPTGFIGARLHALGIDVAFTRVGVVIALMFVGLPFVVRTLEPVLLDLEIEAEEAAESLGASRLQTLIRVVFPNVWPALVAGFAQAFARGIGEFGSVVFIAGNVPQRTEIAPLLIVTKLEQYDFAGASAVAAVMLLVSVSLLFAVNLGSAHGARRA